MSISTNVRAETLVSVRSINGSPIGKRIESLTKYASCLGLLLKIVEPGAGSHRTNAETRSGHEPSPRSADTMKRNSVAPMAAGDDPSDSPPDPDPEWIANELREQSRREY